MIQGVFLTKPLTVPILTLLADLGVNEVVLHWRHCDNRLTGLLRGQGIRVHAEISLFSGQELWQRYPASRPVERSGQPMEPIHWYYGVCPNNPDVRREKLAEIDTVLADITVDGLWLDFIRYPCHWEAVREHPIAEYCFCSNCLDQYTADVGEKPEGEAWIDWKCAQITGFVKEIRKRIEASGKPLQFGLFAVPWSSADYDGAIRSVIGQDFTDLAKDIDVFGIMAYHKLIDRPVVWISEIVQEVSHHTGKTVLPLVQTMDEPEKVDETEFEDSLQIGMQDPSNGVIVFYFEDLLKDDGKLDVLKRVFHS